MSSPIPLFYRFIFLWYEPLSAAYGVYLTLVTPNVYLGHYFPDNSTTWNHEYDFWFGQMAAAFFYVATSQAILFRYTNDIGVWKILNACLVGWDIILLYSYWIASNAQGRDSPLQWLPGEWTKWSLTFGLGLIRAAFVLGVGLKEGKPPAKTN